MLIQQPERQGNADFARARHHVMGEAPGKAGIHECASGDLFCHEERLRYVDLSGKRKVYIPGGDALDHRLHNVDMVEKPPFPNHLRAWREFRHLTQDELAEMVGSSKATIGHLENGVRRLSDKWLTPLAKALNTSPGYILDHDPNDLPTAVLDVWADIPTEQREQALKVLQSFRRTGTDG